MGISLSLLAMALSGVIELAFGIRLTVSSFRTGGLPERSFGVALTLTAVGHASGAIARAADLRDELAALGGLIVLAVALVAFAFRQIFYPRSRAALVGALVLGAVPLVVFVQQLATGQLRAPFSPTGFSLSACVTNAAWLITLTWGAAAAWQARIQARRQLKLGLVDPFMPTRMALWSWASLSFAAFVGALLLEAVDLAPDELTTGLQPFLALLSVTLMWVAFFPPATLRQAVERAHE